MIWDLKPDKKGKVLVGSDRGCPCHIAFEVHGHGPNHLVVRSSSLFHSFIPNIPFSLNEIRESAVSMLLWHVDFTRQPVVIYTPILARFYYENTSISLPNTLLLRTSMKDKICTKTYSAVSG